MGRESRSIAAVAEREELESNLFHLLRGKKAGVSPAGLLSYRARGPRAALVRLLGRFTGLVRGSMADCRNRLLSPAIGQRLLGKAAGRGRSRAVAALATALGPLPLASRLPSTGLPSDRSTKRVRRFGRIHGRPCSKRRSAHRHVFNEPPKADPVSEILRPAGMEQFELTATRGHGRYRLRRDIPACPPRAYALAWPSHRTRRLVRARAGRLPRRSAARR